LEPTSVPLRAGLALRVVVGVDLVLLAAACTWALLGLPSTPGPGAVPPWMPAGVGAWAVLSVLADLGSLAMNGNAQVWRRRLALLPVVATLWRGGPLGAPWLQLGAVAWGGVLWVVLLRETARLTALAPRPED
jgi:hypothetical protein